MGKKRKGKKVTDDVQRPYPGEHGYSDPDAHHHHGSDLAPCFITEYHDLTDITTCEQVAAYAADGELGQILAELAAEERQRTLVRRSEPPAGSLSSGEFICPGWDECHFGLMWSATGDPLLHQMALDSIEEMVELHEFVCHGIEAE